ncbi:MAG: hypothetical protein IM526_02950 [Microcystis sp. M38BS1]|jgi:hypothetical protein|uniref:hypothetical protein n=1 Tax=Microcystis sp. M38BS1 TaxID=2771188 RepID=UPI0031FBDA26|nr:hypothetical protein [Microcystis sp. M38BS1]MCA6582621.1 hypothetical protein [Pseudanabaena sp. M34BS1SP1A06MG]
MQHFANFIRLSDKNINAARKKITELQPNGWTELSGFKSDNTPSALKLHDTLQHRLIDKPIFKAATGIDPNTLFPSGSPQQATKMMPLVQQSPSISRDRRNVLNETIEKMVDVGTFPSYRSRLPVDTMELLPNTKFDAVMPYIRKKAKPADRLAAEAISMTFLPTSSNEEFRNIYLDTAQRDSRIRAAMKERLPKLATEKLQPNASAGQRLRAKLEDRKNYSKQFDWTRDLSAREDRLNQYRQTGLMPR